MKIFISWSGVRSKHIANALREWLPNVIQAVEPFISTQDVAKGTRGNVVIASQLQEANFGIICLTPENITAPWILFEAGALSKLSSAYVCTYLYELEPSDIPQPLGQFQHTKASKVETKSLVEAINTELKPAGLDTTRLNVGFEVWWPRLEYALNNLPAKLDEEAVPETRSAANKIDEILDLLREQKVRNEPRKMVSRSPLNDILGIDALSGNSHELSPPEAFRAFSEGIAIKRNQVSSAFFDMLISNRLITVASDDELVLTDSGVKYLLTRRGP